MTRKDDNPVVERYSSEKNPHKDHRTNREGIWEEGVNNVSLRECKDCKVMFEIEYWNGR